MNNKEILIDGVNVALCEFHTMYDTVYKKGYCKCHNVSCLLNKGCDFKQLAREKQKNKELEQRLEEAILDDDMMCINGLNEEVEELKQKNKDIRETLEEIRNNLFTGECKGCEGYSPNCNNIRFCQLQHCIKNKINEVMSDER